MTSRNMTEVFTLMRNNAIQNRNMYDERVSIFVGHIVTEKQYIDPDCDAGN